MRTMCCDRLCSNAYILRPEKFSTAVMASISVAHKQREKHVQLAED